MSQFAFEGRREQTGESVRGTREAPSHAVLGRDLLADGILLTHFEEQKKAQAPRRLFTGLLGRVPVLERVLFARYFALMLRAGLDIKRSLKTLHEQTKNRSMRTALGVLQQDIEKGKTLAESMAVWPKVFPAMFTSFIRVGETTGRLEQSLQVLAEQLQKEYELKRAVRGALLYPAVILVALVAVAFAMLVFVIPKLAEVFKGFDVELPLLTRMLLMLGTFMEVYWYLVLLGMGLLAVAGWWLWRMPVLRAKILHVFLFMPVLGSIMQQVNLARFSRSLSSLLKSGVAFTEALDIMSANTPHPSYSRVLKESSEYVKKGKSLSEFLATTKRLFPVLMLNVVRVGEETGELDVVLEETARFYESEIDQVMKNLTSILEPVLMIIMGLAVGALAVSVIQPIYGLVNVL